MFALAWEQRQLLGYTRVRGESLQHQRESLID